MNITLDLSKGQLSKLRNGHGIRISPTMVGSGVDLIVDPMTYNNMMKKLDRAKGVIIKMGMDEIEMNRMEGTGLFMVAGNKSGKISRIKKANKWKDFSVETARDGIDLGKYGYDTYQKAVNPVTSKFKSLFGNGIVEDVKQKLKPHAKKALEYGFDYGSRQLKKKLVDMSGLGIIGDVKSAYNKNVKNTRVGKAIRDNADDVLSDGFDKAVNEIKSRKGGKSLGNLLAMNKKGIVKKAVSGLGLRLQGEGLTMGKGTCGMCGGSMNDKFLFSDVAL
jgi:hypothetical protein